MIDLPALLTTFRRAHPGVTIRLSHDAAPVLASAVTAATRPPAGPAQALLDLLSSW